MGAAPAGLGRPPDSRRDQAMSNRSDPSFGQHETPCRQRWTLVAGSAAQSAHHVRHASRARDPGAVGEFCLDNGDLQVPQPGPGRTPGTSDVRARVAEQAVGRKETSGRRAADWEGALQTPTPACTRRSPGKVVRPRREEIMSDRVWRRSINRKSSDNSGESLARAVEGGPRKPPGCRPCSSVSRGTCGWVPASLPGLRAWGPRKAGPPT